MPWQEKVCEKSHAATDADGDKCSGSSRIYEMVLHQGKALEMRHSLLYSSSKIMDDAWRTQRSSVSMANQTSGLSAIVAAGDSLPSLGTAGKLVICLECLPQVLLSLATTTEVQDVCHQHILHLQRLNTAKYIKLQPNRVNTT